MMSVPTAEVSDNSGTDWYEKFHDYDFDNDPSFQQGLQKVKEIPSFTEADYLKAKIFYFSRSFHPVNVTDYNTWLQKLKADASSLNEHSTYDTTEPTEQKLSLKGEVTVSSNGNNETEKQDNKIENTTTEILLHSDNRNDISKEDKDLSENLNTILSLADVAELIEKGVPLPGIKDLNITPLEIDPVPSCLQRKNKPWEK